jgi:hypothetical protein
LSRVKTEVICLMQEINIFFISVLQCGLLKTKRRWRRYLFRTNFCFSCFYLLSFPRPAFIPTDIHIKFLNVVCLFSWRYSPLWLYFHSPVSGYSLLVFGVSWSHTTTRHSRQESSGRVINPSQRPPPDNTQHSQQTNIHASRGIRTHNLSRRAAEDLRLRPRGHWDRQFLNVSEEIFPLLCTYTKWSI